MKPLLILIMIAVGAAVLLYIAPLHIRQSIVGKADHGGQDVKNGLDPDADREGTGDKKIAATPIPGPTPVKDSLSEIRQQIASLEQEESRCVQAVIAETQALDDYCRRTGRAPHARTLAELDREDPVCSDIARQIVAAQAHLGHVRAALADARHLLVGTIASNAGFRDPDDTVAGKELTTIQNGDKLGELMAGAARRLAANVPPKLQPDVAAALAVDLNKIRQDRDAIRAELAIQQARGAALTTERDRLKAQVAKGSAADASNLKIEDITNQWKKQAADMTRVAAENAQLRQFITQVSSERDHFKEQLTVATADVTSLNARSNQLEAVGKQARSDIQRLEGIAANLAVDKRTLEESLKQRGAVVQQLGQETDQLQRALDDASQRAKQASDAQQIAVVDAEQARADLARANAAAQSQINSLQSQLSQIPPAGSVTYEYVRSPREVEVVQAPPTYTYYYGAPGPRVYYSVSHHTPRR